MTISNSQGFEMTQTTQDDVRLRQHIHHQRGIINTISKEMHKVIAERDALHDELLRSRVIFGIDQADLPALLKRQAS